MAFSFGDIHPRIYSVMMGFSLISIIVPLLQITLSTGQTTEIPLKAAVGKAVNFNMPSAEICAPYFLTDFKNHVIVSVYKSSTNVSSLYGSRSTSMFTDEPERRVIFTLHYIQDSDYGTYLTNPPGKAPIDCWVKYVLKKDDDPAYWLNWEPWSSCQATCGYGVSIRTRTCSEPGMCSSGESTDSRTCNTGVMCVDYAWSSWSDWSPCDITCGSASKTRYRKCMRNSVHTVDNDYCIGDVIDHGTCIREPCGPGDGHHMQATTARQRYHWTEWDTWSTCSESCGTGSRSRDRKCEYYDRIIDIKYCLGAYLENESCIISSCDHDSSGQTDVVELPVSAIVGAASAVFIIILAVVICVLVTRLRSKRARTIPTIVNPGPYQNGEIVGYTPRPKSSIVSFTSMDVSSGHTYDTINDDDVKSMNRQSVVTIDNQYVSLPKSPSTSPTIDESVAYDNTQHSVFLFGKNGSGQKISNAYLNVASTSAQSSGNQLNVPRHLSVDSQCYLMPGTAAERAIKRNQKYRRQET